MQSARFLQDVEYWKRQYSDKGWSWARAAARKLVRMYLEDDAAMRINIGDSMATKTRAAVSRHDLIPIDVFDDAVHEVVQMLVDGPFRTFVLKRTRRNTSAPASGRRHRRGHRSEHRPSTAVVAVVASKAARVAAGGSP